MKQLLFCLAYLFFTVFSFAGRLIPQNVQIFKIQNVQGSLLEVRPPEKGWVYWLTLGIENGVEQMKLSPALRIHDESNRFIVKALLPSKIGSVVALRYDQLKMVNEIWILTPKELANYRVLSQQHSAN